MRGWGSDLTLAGAGVSQVSLAAKQLSVWTSRDAEMAFHLSTYGAVALGAPLPRNVPLRSGA